MSKPKKKILVIDDDSGIRESVRLAIEEIQLLDIEVTESIDVATGIKQMEKTNPDIIILDLHLPDKSGFDFMDIMHEKKQYAHINVIMLTVDDRLENVFEAEDKGIYVYHFLGKPFNVSDLQAVILSICLPAKS